MRQWVCANSPGAPGACAVQRAAPTQPPHSLPCPHRANPCEPQRSLRRPGWPSSPCLPAPCPPPKDHTICTVDAIVRPNTTAELAAAVASLRARAVREGRTLKMRPARNGFASMAAFPCPEQRVDTNQTSSERALLTAALLLEGLNKARGRAFGHATDGGGRARRHSVRLLYSLHRSSPLAPPRHAPTRPSTGTSPS